MASSSSAAARARLFNELSHSRASSPIDDNVFTTATAMSFRDALHSTPQRQDQTTTQRLSLNDHSQMFGGASVSSDDMSIEIGRGGKRTTYARDDEMSSHAIFDFGEGNSLYETTATPPPAKSRSGQQRKLDGSLRKTASLRRAISTSKNNVAANATEAGASAINNPALSLANRPSRFTSARHGSGEVNNNNGIPSRFSSTQGLFNSQSNAPQTAIQNNVTVHSTTYTANQSFILPDLPDLTEIVSGVRKDGTPIFNRAAKSRSRFTSAAYAPQPHAHVPIESIAVPDEEKAIFASLQLLKDRVSQLEMENREAQKRAEEYVGEILDLRGQLSAVPRRQDSAIGSDDEAHSRHRLDLEIPKLEGSFKALQDRCQRSERKASVAEITVKRVTNERDALMTQIGKAYFCNEELTKENEELRDSQVQLKSQNDELQAELSQLKNAMARLQPSSKQTETKDDRREQKAVTEAVQLASTIQSQHDMASRNASRINGVPAISVAKSRKRDEPNTKETGPTKRRLSRGHAEATDDLATRIEVEIQRYRDNAATQASQRSRDSLPATLGTRPRSKSQKRQERSVSAPLLEAEPTTTQNFTQTSQHTRNSLRKGPEAHAEDLTMLSNWHTDEIIDLAKMRRKLEEEMRDERAKKRAPAASDETLGNPAARLRKSSLKDLTARYNEDTGRVSINGEITAELNRTSKTVRVQSPRSSDAVSHFEHHEEYTDTPSMLSSVGRRRRIVESEGDTSAFIVPDITLHGVQALPTALVQACIKHDKASCTACPSNHTDETIPAPIPVTDRDIDATNATIRPSQSPENALATVIKHLEDEITHLKIQREAQNRLYNQHDPAVSKRRRSEIKSKLDRLTAEIEKRSDQVYALYDVLEGQKQQAAYATAAGETHEQVDVDEINETLASIGIDPAENSGRIGRGALANGLDGIDELSDGELPWEGISDIEDDEN